MYGIPRGEGRDHGQLGKIGRRHRCGAGDRIRVRATFREGWREGRAGRRPGRKGAGGGGAVTARRGRRGHVRRLRRGRPAPGRGAGREDGRDLRRPRRDDRQRRGAPSRRRAGAGGRGLRSRGAGEPQGVLPHRPSRGEADGRAGPRRGDHPHVVDPGVHHQCEPALLCRMQGRGEAAHGGDGAGPRTEGHPRQRHRARQHRHRHGHAAHIERGGAAYRDVAHADGAAGGSRRRLPRWPRSSRATRRRTSPARRWSRTAAASA